MLNISIFLLLNFMIMTLFIYHPLTMSMILLMAIIIISIINILLIKFSWFSFIIFIIMIGGLLIIFTYMTSIASNESFKFNKYLIWLSLMLLIMLMFSLKINFMEMNEYLNLTLFFSKYFNYPLNIFLIFLFIYMYITLIACVKITNFNQGPLRQKF